MGHHNPVFVSLSGFFFLSLFYFYYSRMLPEKAGEGKKEGGC